MNILKIAFTAVVLGSSSPLFAQETAPELTVVATTQSRNWNGLAVSNDKRIFADFPRWEKGDNPSVVEIRNGREIPFPGGEWNSWAPGKDPGKAFVSVNSLYLHRSDNHLWVTDSGDPFSEGVVPGAPKLVEIDLSTDPVVNTYLIPEKYAPKGSHLNDIKIAGRQVFITESGTGAILILDRTTGSLRRVLAESKLTKADPQATATVDGFRLQDKDGRTPVINADQIELSSDNQWLYFMSPFGPNLYKVATADLLDPRLSGKELESRIVIDRKVSPVGGTMLDAEGNLYLSEIETKSIRCEGPDKQTKWVIKDDRLVWPDAYSITPDGTVYVVVAQISNMPFMQAGKDLRKPPYYIFSFKPTR